MEGPGGKLLSLEKACADLRNSQTQHLQPIVADALGHFASMIALKIEGLNLVLVMDSLEGEFLEMGMSIAQAFHSHYFLAADVPNNL